MPLLDLLFSFWFFSSNIYSNNIHIYTVKHNTNNSGLERKLRAYLILVLYSCCWNIGQLLVDLGSNSYHPLSLAGIKSNEKSPEYTSIHCVHIAYVYQ